MTDVQRMTLNECLDGSDVIAQARTGTGKTLAFLLPIVQRLLRDPNLERRGGADSAGIRDTRALIISPTRELAEQIAVEAQKVTAGTAIRVQIAVGGTGKSYHLNKMRREGCHLLIGTPGRVQDICSDSNTGFTLDKLDTFVLDEADRLLDIGFMPAIQEIAGYMPTDRERQTLMFSATVPKEVVGLVRSVMRPNFKFVRTIDPSEPQTHERVPQKVVLVPGLQNNLPAVLEIAHNALEKHREDPENNMPVKILVFLPSTSEVHLAAEIFSNMRDPSDPNAGRSVFGGMKKHPLGDLRIFEIHSKLSQQQRSASSQGFRRAESAILFSSDVSARGMDFPNVSHVIQIGLPRTADDYIHRVGRTGRAGKGGEGWLILLDDERNQFRRALGEAGSRIQEDRSLESAKLDMTKGAQLPAVTARLMQIIESGVRATDSQSKSAAYLSMLGPLSQASRNKQTVIDLMNDLARFGWGMAKPPGLPQGVISRLGLSGLSGVEVQEYQPRRDDRGRGGFGDRYGGGDRGGRGGNGMGQRRGGGFDRNDPFGQGLTGAGVGGGDRGRDGGFGGRSGGGRDGGFGGRGDSGFGGRSGGFGGPRDSFNRGESRGRY